MEQGEGVAGGTRAIGAERVSYTPPPSPYLRRPPPSAVPVQICVWKSL